MAPDKSQYNEVSATVLFTLQALTKAGVKIYFIFSSQEFKQQC